MVSHGCGQVPVFDGRGASFLDYEHQAHLWTRTARTAASERASVWILHMQPAPRQVCLADGSDILGRSDGVAKILEISRNYFAPEAADAIRQQVVRYVRLRRTDQPIDGYIAEYDLLCRTAESEMEMGAGFLEQSVSMLRMGNAALSHHQKSLAPASCHKSLEFEGASAYSRRLLGSRGSGSGSRQDALFAEEVADPRVCDEDLDISAAYRKAETTGLGEEEKGGYNEAGRGQG